MENQQLCDTTETSQSCEDRILAELIAMGFELPAALEAIGAVGQSLSDAVEFILAGNPLNACEGASGIRNDQTNLFTTYSGEKCSAGGNLRSCNSIHATKQHLITEKFKPTGRRDKSITFGSCSNSPIGDAEGNATFELLKMKRTSLPCPTDSGFKSGFTSAPNDLVSSTLLSQTKDLRQPSLFPGELCAKTLCADPLQEADSKWESKAEVVLQKYFGYTALKSFQKEALQAWAVHQDCLVLAATGSGKSLCFQLPALMSGKVVVVISPLISLMHDQCLKLARHGVSACFLGSGQVDKSVEDRAMAGLYDIIYLCPETLLRVVGPLQKLVENRGIALFAIDEVHCVSKWGHDFRPDYRRLSVLKEKFKASNFKSVEYDIPIMALTATATHRVREDIMNCLGMKADVKIVLTSFFRPNLRFSVHHSKTSWLSSYEMDFQELITVYTQEGGNRSKRGVHLQKPNHDKDWVPVREEVFESDETSSSESESYEENTDGHDHNDRTCSIYEDVRDACGGHQMTVEYLEDEHDEQLAEDFDLTFGEFQGSFPVEDRLLVPEDKSFVTTDQSSSEEKNSADLKGPLRQGPSIIYMPTRKETQRLARFLCKSGVKAAAYHAKLPKRHLREVHEQFHHNSLQVVVATIAFGMGIDKSNVRRIIHYGWPQSLEAYYQEAGRAGRDGLLAECTLYADLTKIPSLLPSRRDAEQTQQALIMLSECFRYGVSTTCCRAKMLVQYFGEDFMQEKCQKCDICVNGLPKVENLSKEAELFLRVLVKLQMTDNNEAVGLISTVNKLHNPRRCVEKVPFMTIINMVQEQEMHAKDRLWWRGFGRLLEDNGFIRDSDNIAARKGNQQRLLTVKYPEPTVLGLDFLNSCNHINSNGTSHHKLYNDERPVLYLYPEGDMLEALKTPKINFKKGCEWGRGWADPEIRQQRLKGRRRQGKKHKRASRKRKPDLNSVRGRLSAKLSRKNH